MRRLDCVSVARFYNIYFSWLDKRADVETMINRKRNNYSQWKFNSPLPSLSLSYIPTPHDSSDLQLNSSTYCIIYNRRT
jgi:hypothetical protein